MSQLEKAISRLLTCPKDYTYSEAKFILEKLGFKEDNKGKTSGSRVKYQRDSDNKIIMLHKPHPNPEMKQYVVKNLIEFLKGIGEI